MLNPLTFTEKVVADFLRYQLTTYPFSDQRLHAQLRALLSLEESRRSPLVRGPYVSLSRAFREGAPVRDLVRDEVLHPLLSSLHPHPGLWGHQEDAIRAIANGAPTLVSTGTGSGKTECFLYPVISRCLQLRDEKAPVGIVAVLVYPMNALAEDQLIRLRDLLAGTGVTFGMYVGKTPGKTADVAGQRLLPGSSRADYRAAIARAAEEKRETAVHPPEECVSREQMRSPGKQPRILLTNVKQLELLLTRQADIQMFDGARLDFLVFDEAHTFGGAAGGETACLVRRLREFCGRRADETVCIGTSATLTSPGQDGTEVAKDFAARFFGVDRDRVRVVGEQYQTDDWAQVRKPSPEPAGEVAEHLRAVLAAVDKGEQSGSAVAAAFQSLTGNSLPAEDWRERLYERLAENDLCFRTAESLARPMPLENLAARLTAEVGRAVSEEEIVCWLVLGAASRRGDRPMLRPVVHAFVRGIDGAVVTFFEPAEGPSLWLSAQDEKGGPDALFPLPVTTCSTCGQHYFVHFVQDIRVGSKGLGGGEAVEGRRVWRPLDDAQGGNRVVLLDKLVSAQDDDDDPDRTQEVFFCRSCGALHSHERGVCDACGRKGKLVRLLAVEYGDTHPGWLTACLSCKAPGRPWGGRYREPARPVRAVAVSDVHVLAQNMLQQADRRRLLVFADNRQDAAFQAGWMRDHARRFRLRALMAERIAQGPVSVGDLVAYLDDLLDGDDELSQALLPEVWTVARKEGAGVQHAEERKYFLRISLLREIATGPKQRVGLEPWGRLRISYVGLDASTPFVRGWAQQIGVAPELLADGVAAILDLNRRGLHLLDREGGIFSRFWMDGDREIQRGYLPLIRGVPKGLKLERSPGDDESRVTQWLSTKGDTMVRQAARNFGVPKEQVEQFVRELWECVSKDLKLLAPVTLKGARGRALPNCGGVRQVDADRLLLERNSGRWRCDICHRTQVRPTPKNACLAWRCAGSLVYEKEDPDNYDLLALDQRFAMLRPAEHSAQVPAAERERLERAFKAETGESVNTLVCTPTLELGVDIGGLDTVLLRNVPPLASNYWQRVGRAGRRNRLAVNLTYARPVSHDRAYFAEPMKLLDGRVEPPRFNLKNDLMVAKHVHAAVLTRLWSLARPTVSPLPEEDRTEVEEALRVVLPLQVKDYLFDSAGHVRSEPLSVDPLNTVVTKHEGDLVAYMVRAFPETWPVADAEVVSEERLREFVLGTTADLARVLHVLKKRLDWCLGQMRRLDEERLKKGTLDPDEDALRARCDRLVKRFKGLSFKKKRESEGYDDTNTYGMLAFEGFLPGYGLEIGSIRATALVPRSIEGAGDFDLPRAPAMALREYVPGNLIYANGRRFMARYFHFEAQEPVLFQVDLAHQAVSEVGTATSGAVAALGASALKAVSVCDVDLIHYSHISDEEESRFQLPVAVYGYETGRHGHGSMFTWGDRALSLRRNVHLRLVNVGPSQLVRQARLGYPLCLVSGQSRSPLASERELEEFNKAQQERTGKPTERVGFFADVIADALALPNCPSRDEAYSVCEALRLGMSQVLDMEPDDLEILVVGHPGSDAVDGLLYDPMPGGSGLLDQACGRWEEVVRAAIEVLEGCASACVRSCIDCMHTFRNSFFHAHLDRHLAQERLGEWGGRLDFLHEITERVSGPGASEQTKPANEAEAELRGMLERAGFPPGEWHKQIVLGKPLGSTSPDVFWPGDEPREPGVCVYLDGLSRQIHGNPTTTAQDKAIRDELRNRGYEVFVVHATQLADRKAMGDVFFRLARVLLDKDTGRRLRDDPSWFEAPNQPELAAESSPPYKGSKG